MHLPLHPLPFAPPFVTHPVAGHGQGPAETCRLHSHVPCCPFSRHRGHLVSTSHAFLHLAANKAITVQNRRVCALPVRQQSRGETFDQSIVTLPFHYLLLFFFPQWQNETSHATYHRKLQMELVKEQTSRGSGTFENRFPSQ